MPENESQPSNTSAGSASTDSKSNHSEQEKMANVQWLSLSLKWIRLLVSLFAFGLLYLVYDRSEPTSAQKTDNDAADKLEDNFLDAASDIPAPSEIFSVIQASGADFDPILLNDYKKYASYCRSQQKAAFNLGVYETDLYNQNAYGIARGALTYMEVCWELAETVGAQEALDAELLQRFESNLDNPDSLNYILNQFNNSLLDYLDEQQHNDLSALVICGIVIESLYISTQILENYPIHLLHEDMRMQVLSPLITTVNDQKRSVKYLIELLEDNENKGDWELALFGKLQGLYAEYPDKELQKLVSEKQVEELENNETVAKLANLISEIRSLFIT